MISEKRGKVVKGLGGLFEVRIEDESGVTRLFSRAKGNLKRDEDKVLVGDNVIVQIDDLTPDGIVISEVLDRKNSLIRPPMANLDYLFIVFAAKKPVPVLETVDKLTAIAEHNGIEPVIVITKSDLDAENADKLSKIYSRAGFATFVTSSVSHEGTEELKAYVGKNVTANKSAAFAGASGVGKSTLINALFPTLSLATSEISRKIERGRHTTRHVELFDISDTVGTGFLADTPGFSLIDFSRFDFFSLEDLLSNFRDLSCYIGKCRYADCSHTAEGEDECALAKAVRSGEVSESRHSSYKSIYNVLKQKKTYE